MRGRGIEINKHFPRFGHDYHPEIAAQRRAELQRDIEQYLANGGTITIIPTGCSALNKNAMSEPFTEARTTVSKRGGRALAKTGRG